eukprot:3958036-Prymnesium_polylepis.1
MRYASERSSAQRTTFSAARGGSPAASNSVNMVVTTFASATGVRAVRMMATASARCWTAHRLWSGHSVLSIMVLRLSDPSTTIESSVVTRALSFSITSPFSSSRNSFLPSPSPSTALSSTSCRSSHSSGKS